MTRLPDDEPSPIPSWRGCSGSGRLPPCPTASTSAWGPRAEPRAPAADLAAVLRDVHPRSLPVALALLLALLLTALWRPRDRAPDVESAESSAPTRAARQETQPGLKSGLAGFEPVREMNVTVLPESAP
jgi:hypothetical protein